MLLFQYILVIYLTMFYSFCKRLTSYKLGANNVKMRLFFVCHIIINLLLVIIQMKSSKCSRMYDL